MNITESRLNLGYVGNYIKLSVYAKKKRRSYQEKYPRLAFYISAYIVAHAKRGLFFCPSAIFLAHKNRSTDKVHFLKEHSYLLILNSENS